MAADVTLAAAARPGRRGLRLFGLSWRVLGLVIVGVMTAELLLFLPSIARYRHAYLEQLIESGTLAALALDATPDNMVTDEVKHALLNNARVDAVVLVERNKAKRALLNIAPRPDMPTFNLKERGMLGLIWDALATMSRDGAYYTRVGGESMRLPNAMVWIVVDELPMRLAMYGYAGRVLALSIMVAMFTAALLYLALRWLVLRPLQDLSADMTAFRSAPEGPGIERAPTQRNDEIGVLDREFQNLQRELRASLRQKSRLAEVGAASNKINHDLRNMLSTARLLSDRLARSDDERTRALAPTILNTIDRAARLASDALEYVRDRPTPRIEAFDLADLVDEVGVALQEAGEDNDPNQLRDWRDEIDGECRISADRDLLYRVLVNLGRNAFDAGATMVSVRARARAGHMSIDITDNGPGIPPAVAAQLFRPFTTGGRAGGAGLGLAIARDLVRAHGGDIALMESTARGTTFRFTLPL
ncbi:MAG: HAMP domain-containing histidine kinase [Proteobacteria bacterium]|nr:HAMP domain-containing histidine kinase [Pseudomonadota bacterium]